MPDENGVSGSWNLPVRTERSKCQTAFPEDRLPSSVHLTLSAYMGRRKMNPVSRHSQKIAHSTKRIQNQLCHKLCHLDNADQTQMMIDFI